MPDTVSAERYEMMWQDRNAQTRTIQKLERKLGKRRRRSASQHRALRDLGGTQGTHCPGCGFDENPSRFFYCGACGTELPGGEDNGGS